MENIDEKLFRIEEKIDKQKKYYFLEKVLIPFLIAMVPSMFTLYIASKSLNIQKENTSYQKIEILNKLMADFSSDQPEKIIISIDIIKSMIDIEDSVSKKIEMFGYTLTQAKIKDALNKGGEKSSNQIEEVYQTLQGTNNSISNELKQSITNKKYYVIVASGTTRSNALAFIKQLNNTNDFKESFIIKTQSGYAISIGEWPYDLAIKKKQAFIDYPRFHPDFQNLAYLQIRKDDWEIVRQ